MSDDYTGLNIDLDESDMECLRHGSGITFEFDGEDDHILAVTVGREDKELDREWLLGEVEADNGLLTGKQWRTFGGIAVLMFGMVQAVEPLIDVFPMFTGGTIALLGAIFIMEQARPNGSPANDIT